MKVLLIVILLFVTFRAYCPEAHKAIIEKVKALSRFDKLVDAVTWVESRHGVYIWNPAEGAVGWFQVRQCRVDDYNSRTGNHYRLEDFYDYALSRKMFIYYAEMIGNDFERVAREWNGGPAGMSYKQTKIYYQKVKSAL